MEVNRSCVSLIFTELFCFFLITGVVPSHLQTSGFAPVNLCLSSFSVALLRIFKRPWHGLYGLGAL